MEAMHQMPRNQSSLRATSILVVLLPALAWAKGGGSSGGTVHVQGYTRSDGTYVRAYDRAAPGSHSGGAALSDSDGANTSSDYTSAAEPETGGGGEADGLDAYLATRPADIASAIRAGHLQVGMSRTDAGWAMHALRLALYGEDSAATIAKASMKRMTGEPEQWRLEVAGKDPQIVTFIGGSISHIVPESPARAVAEVAPAGGTPPPAKAPATPTSTGATSKPKSKQPKPVPAKTAATPEPAPTTPKIESKSGGSDALGGCLCMLFPFAIGGLVAYWLARRRRPASPATQPQVSSRALPGGRLVEVVGESHYQPALEMLAGGRSDKSANVKVTALLVPEPTNRFDRNAVAVHIGGHLVGYLSREDALVYKPVAERLAAEGVVGACEARIVGGWSRSWGDKGAFGVKLDLSFQEAVRSEDDLVAATVRALKNTKTPAARKKLVADAHATLTSQELRMRLLVEASQAEVEAVLAKVAGLKTDSAKRRNLSAALDELRQDSVPDEFQAAQIAMLEEQLRKLDA